MKTLLIALLFTNLAFAAKKEAPTRWNKLMGLINHEMKILESAKKKGPDLQYRLLELHSEKLKLIHEKNNKTFMAAAIKAKSGKDKESYFTETRAYYDKTKKFGFDIMKAYPSSSVRAQVLYALALNSRDYGHDRITEKYLLEAISLISDANSSLRHHAETALADFYYNEKRYPDAITYYQRAIKKKEDDWLTKHLFNLSWCFLKVRDFDQAISTIKEAYAKTKNPHYVNIRDQILENIGSFYVYAGRPLDGLDFYLKNEKDPVPYLMSMALKAADKGHEKETGAILDAAQKLVEQNKWYHYQEQVFHAYLDFYRHYNRFTEHEQTSRKLVAYYKKAAQEPKLKLKTEMKDEAVEKIRTLAGFLQVKLAKDVKEDSAQYKEEELRIVLSYFSHLIQLDPARKAEYYYFRAETYYSVKRFKDSAPSYVEAVNEAKATKNMDLARKALNSMLALTALEVMDKNENKKYLIFAYTEYTSLWPREEKSEQIYPKLFEIYREARDDEKAAAVLRNYNKHYPEHLGEQQKLMTKILDQFIEKKNTVKLANWIQEFKKGFLSFPKDTIEKTEIVLGNILFLRYQEMAKKGDKLAAAKGFESIFVHKLYPDKVKSQSAFFAALSYLELGETVKSYHWQALAYTKMTDEEKLARRDEQLKITERTYKLQDFATAFKLSDFLLKKFCNLKDSTQGRFFEIAIMTSLVEEKPAVAETTVTSQSHCVDKPALKDSALAQIYQYFEKKGDYYGLRLFVHRNRVEPYITQYRYTLQKWYWERSDVNTKEVIRQEMRSLKHPETLGWLEEIALFDKAKKEKDQLLSYVIWNKPAFNGDEFNKSLENYLLKLQGFRNNYQGLMQSTQIDLAIISTRVFSEVYQHVGKTIQTQRPAGMDAATLKDFSEAMRNLSGQFITASKQFEKQLDKSVKDKAKVTWGSRSIASVEEVENPVFSFFTGLTMDKAKERD